VSPKGTSTAATDQKLRQAANRLYTGTAIETDGRLTARNLAAEAGVSRTALYRSPVLQEFNDHAARLLGGDETAVGLIDQVKGKLRTLRAQHRELQTRHAQLQRDHHDLLQVVNALHAELNTVRSKTTATVTRLPR